MVSIVTTKITKNGGIVTVEDIAAGATANGAKGIGIGELEVSQVRGFQKP